MGMLVMALLRALESKDKSKDGIEGTKLQIINFIFSKAISTTFNIGF
jgi:hypothetical protein